MDSIRPCIKPRLQSIRYEAADQMDSLRVGRRGRVRRRRGVVHDELSFPELGSAEAL